MTEEIKKRAVKGSQTQEIAPRAIEPAVMPQSTADGFISQALASGAPVETLERLFGLREKMKAEAAKEAFVVALGTFQGECPVIEKTKKVMNKDGRSVRYQYAPLESIIEQIKKPLAHAQLSYRWETRQDKGNVTAICLITHILGHTESTDFTVEVDPEAYMTSPQKAAAALTFAKRYTLTNGLGIATADEDTDATTVKKEPDAKTAGARIIFRLKALGEKVDTTEQTNEAVRRLVQLEPTKENAEEIAARLQSIIEERQGV